MRVSLHLIFLQSCLDFSPCQSLCRLTLWNLHTQRYAWTQDYIFAHPELIFWLSIKCYTSYDSEEPTLSCQCSVKSQSCIAFVWAYHICLRKAQWKKLLLDSSIVDQRIFVFFNVESCFQVLWGSMWNLVQIHHFLSELQLFICMLTWVLFSEQCGNIEILVLSLYFDQYHLWK